MKFVGQYFIICLTATCLSGCAVYRTVRQAASGTAVSEKTQMPLDAVKVYFTGDTTEYFTDKDGKFMIPSKKAWEFIPMVFPVDRIYRSELIFEKSGYKTQKEQFGGTTSQDNLTIKLKRQRE